MPTLEVEFGRVEPDDFDALCEIVDALARHVEYLTHNRRGIYARADIERIESIAGRAQRLYRKRVER